MDIMATAVELISLLAQDTRLLRLDFPRGDGPAGITLLANRLEADEGLSQDFTYTVEAISDDANIPLESVLGRMVTISMVRDDGSLRYFNGYVFEFGFVRTDGGLAFYRMVLGPWLRLLRLRKDCALFQNMSVTGICEKTFTNYIQRDYQYRLVSELPNITLAVQYNETDHNHLHRRLEAAGLYYWYEHRADGHTLWIADDSTLASPVDGDSAIPYRAESGATEDDGIRRWSPSRAAVSGEVTLDSFNFKEPRPARANKLSPIEQGTVPSLEIYESTGAYGYSDDQTGEKLAARRLEEAATDAMTVSATGNHRALMPGHWFTLADHFENGDSAKQHLIVSVLHSASNNYQDGRHSNSSYENTLQCVPLKMRWRPPRFVQCTDTRINGLVTATVVGPEGEEIHTDEFGRVRVQFHWDRNGKFDADSSPWIRVMTSLADSRFGHQSLPRVGQEVAVQFIDGNCDRPLIVGCIHNATNMPTWELPKQRALTGLRSRELKGSRSNHVVLDDTPGKIQAQLRSDHQHSQLSLGHIGRIEDHFGRKEDRGEGWELASDAWGVARAGKGMLITTEARSGATGQTKSMDETAQRLMTAVDRHKEGATNALQGGAQDTPAQQSAVASELQKQNQTIEGGREGGDFPELADPHLVLASHAGIHTTSNSNTHFSSEEHLAMTSGRNLSVVAGDSLFASVASTFRLFVKKAGMKLIAAAGPITVRAKDGDLDAVAKKVLRLISETDWIDIRARKGIRLHGSGSRIDISDKVEFFTESPTLFHGNLETLAPKNSPQPEPEVESLTPTPEQLHFTLQSHPVNGFPYADVPYRLFKGAQEIDSGITDRHGRVIIKHEPGTPEYRVKLANGDEFRLPTRERLAAEGDPDYEEHMLSNQGQRSLDDTTDGRKAR